MIPNLQCDDDTKITIVCATQVTCPKCKVVCLLNQCVEDFVCYMCNTQIKFYKGAPVPVQYNAGNSFSVSEMHSLERKEFFFTNGHGFRHISKIPGNDWVPITTYLPYDAAPRPGLEDGVVDTIEKLVFIHHKGDTFIPDVYEKFHICK